MKKTLICPSGVGDFSWCWSKLYHVRDEVEQIKIADGWPYRTTPYVKLCGVDSEYEKDFTYQTIQLNMAAHQCSTWQQYRDFPAPTMATSANAHLERGRRLEEWMPDLPIEFHYSLAVGVEARLKAHGLIFPCQPLDGPVVGISCASYRGSEAWKTWGRVEWVDFLQRLIAEGWQPLLMGGFWDDLTHGVACELGLPDIVGKTTVEEMVAVLDLLDAYIGFSSGMGVIRTVLRKNAFMLWPDFQVELSTSWAPPDMLEEGSYVAHLWRPVEDVWPVARQFLKGVPYGNAQHITRQQGNNLSPGGQSSQSLVYHQHAQERAADAKVPRPPD